MHKPLLALALLAAPVRAVAADEAPARPMVVVDEAATVREEPPPHGAIGMSTAYRISDGVPAPRRAVRPSETTSPSPEST